MAVALAQLQAWRDRLFESRLSGVREVTDQNGEKVSYRSDSEIASALAAADTAIAAALSGRPAHTILFRSSKGL